MKYSQYIVILSFLISITGIYKFYTAVSVDPEREVMVHKKRPHKGAIIDFVEARLALRYLVYGFLLQISSMMLNQ